MLRILRNERGFTLIELVIIIILIGVLAAIAIPKYVDLRNNAVEAAAQATLDAGRAAIMLDFADDVLNTGGYTSITPNTAAGNVLAAGDVTTLEGLLQANPSYPPSGTYNVPASQGFRWFLVTQGSLSSASTAAPPEIDAIIDVTCASGDSDTSTANDDCFVSAL